MNFVRYMYHITARKGSRLREGTWSFRRRSVLTGGLQEPNFGRPANPGLARGFLQTDGSDESPGSCQIAPAKDDGDLIWIVDITHHIGFTRGAARLTGRDMIVEAFFPPGIILNRMTNVNVYPNGSSSLGLSSLSDGLSRYRSALHSAAATASDASGHRQQSRPGLPGSS